MRVCFAGWLALAGVALGISPGSWAAGDGEAAEWFEWHFAGSARIAADTNGVRARAVFAQPSTRALVDRALSSLARSATRAGSTNAALVREFLDDATRVESVGVLRTNSALPGLEWQVAVRVGAERAKRWAERWTAFVGATGYAVGGSAVTGDWFVGGLKQSGTLELESIYGRLAASSSSSSSSSAATTWLDVKADLGSLARALDWPALPVLDWPRAHLTVGGRGEDLRSTAQLTLPKPVELPLGDWHLPTNTVREPLVGFTAIQGLQPWLERQGSLQALDWPVPNQVYVWAQSVAPYATHVTWEMSEAATRIPAVQAKIKPVIVGLAPWLNFGEVDYIPELTRLAWRGFPLLVPFVNPGADAGFATGGVFPLADPGDPAPAELYAQLRGRTNLVFYAWEVTQPRLEGWRELEMLRMLIHEYAPPATNSLAWTWLRDTNVTARLGNCVTEVTATSPQEFHAVRNSALGLTAFELVRATIWMEGERFPRHTPPPPLQFLRQTPKPAKTPSTKP